MRLAGVMNEVEQNDTYVDMIIDWLAARLRLRF